MKETVKSILSSSKDSISSKRICGVLGWLLSLVILAYCALYQLQAPMMIDTVLYCCMGLLGIDSITSIWKR